MSKRAEWVDEIDPSLGETAGLVHGLPDVASPSIIPQTVEPQYAQCFEAPPVVLGPMTGETYQRTPRKLGMVLARYDFVSRLVQGKHRVAEIGCADAFASPVVGEVVQELDLYDIDVVWRDIALTRRYCKRFFVHDIRAGILRADYEAIYALDLLEHISTSDERAAMTNICASLLHPQGMFIAGCPSLESQPYASEISKQGHVNCRSWVNFQRDMRAWFHNVLPFSLNEHSLRVGHDPMTRYQLVVCCGPKHGN